MNEEFKSYARKGVIDIRPWTKVDEEVYMTSNIFEHPISVSKEDSYPFLASRVGGYVGRNPDNPSDQWYINKEYFDKHYGVRITGIEAINELRTLTQPLANYLREHHSPHTYILVDQQRVEVLSGLTAAMFEEGK